jgi:hypothetical protein
MAINTKTLERNFFRVLNSVVEPAVRKGVASPCLLPSGLIVLESKGFKSGATRRTPLLATRIFGFVFVSTYRGERSFWVKNLQKQPSISFYMGGKPRKAKAFLMLPGKTYKRPKSMPTLVGKLTDRLSRFTGSGWSFAVLMPDKS